MELLTWRQLVQRSGGRAQAERLVREGRWWRVLRGAYAPVEVLDDTAARAAALRLVLPSDAAASHRTALWLLGLDVLGPELEVTVPRGRHLRDRPGLRVTSADLPDSELVMVGDVLAVSAARAAVDVWRTSSLVEAVAVGDAVLRSGAATPEQLLESLERATGLRGVAAARLVVPHLEPRSESPMESRLRMTLVLGGCPRPQAQWDVYVDEGHVGRADLHLDGVVLEYDGRQQRLDKVAFVGDRRRQTRIAETGLELRRFTSYDVYRRPARSVCADVLRAVEQARGRDRSSLRLGPDTLRPPRLRPLPTAPRRPDPEPPDPEPPDREPPDRDPPAASRQPVDDLPLGRPTRGQDAYDGKITDRVGRDGARSSPRPDDTPRPGVRGEDHRSRWRGSGWRGRVGGAAGQAVSSWTSTLPLVALL